MRAGETRLEQARRHVCEVEAIVSRQHKMIACLRSRNLETDKAEKVLTNFERILIVLHKQLYRLEESDNTVTACASQPSPNS